MILLSQTEVSITNWGKESTDGDMRHHKNTAYFQITAPISSLIGNKLLHLLFINVNVKCIAISLLSSYQAKFEIINIYEVCSNII